MSWLRRDAGRKNVMADGGPSADKYPMRFDSPHFGEVWLRRQQRSNRHGDNLAMVEWVVGDRDGFETGESFASRADAVHYIEHGRVSRPCENCVNKAAGADDHLHRSDPEKVVAAREVEVELLCANSQFQGVDAASALAERYRAFSAAHPELRMRVDEPAEFDVEEGQVYVEASVFTSEERLDFVLAILADAGLEVDVVHRPMESRGGADDHLHRSDPEKAERLRQTQDPCASCGHTMHGHMPPVWCEPGFFYSVPIESIRRGLANKPCRRYDRSPEGQDVKCPCQGFIGVSAPVSPDEVLTGNPAARRDELLDQMLQHPEGSPERSAVVERLRSFGWLRRADIPAYHGTSSEPFTVFDRTNSRSSRSSTPLPTPGAPILQRPNAEEE